MSENNSKVSWPHAPVHQLSKKGTYIVTCATYKREKLFDTPFKLDGLQKGLFKYASEFRWRLEAWSIFSNHYHFIGHSPEMDDNAASLKQFLHEFHYRSAAWINELDNSHSRKVWHTFWETLLTYERSYLARLNYVHTNPVKHGLVRVANEYHWCSAKWFEEQASPSQVKTIYSFPSNQLKIKDDFDDL